MSGAPQSHLPEVLQQRFEALIFDWDGTAVPDRRADASRARRLMERLSVAGVHLGVVSGTHVGNVDPQLHVRRLGRGRVWLCLNRGSEVFEVTRQGPELVARRTATAAEEAALDAAASATVERLRRHGAKAQIVSQRLNRRKIDLIPLPEWSDPPKAAIGDLVAAVTGRLLAHGLSLVGVVTLAAEEARRAGLVEPRVTTDAKHVEIGLTDKSDSARWLLEALWDVGVSPSQVLVVGDELGTLGGVPGSDSRLLSPGVVAVSVGVEPEGVPDGVHWVPGGPASFLRLLGDQLERRACGGLPRRAVAPGWTITIAGFDPELERVHESLLAIGDGTVGTRGAALAEHPACEPGTHVSGLYRGTGPDTDLFDCPRWERSTIELSPGDHVRRHLDLHTGVLSQDLRTRQGPITVTSFCSLAQPGLAVLRSRAAQAEPLLCGSRAPGKIEVGGEALGFALDEWTRPAGEAHVVERVARYRRLRRASAHPLPRKRRFSFDAALAGHREAWARRWQSADVAIGGDPDLERASRFALYHLMAAVPESGEAAVGARGLSGDAYRGHVFWDSDVFVLPFLAATHPPAARAMLEYRLRRLPQARARARRLGLRGARFPWESAASGEDVTPMTALDHGGRTVPIRTGLLEEHIVADIAWAVDEYLRWTGDGDFERRGGARLLVETARYWASRLRLDADGSAHIEGVIGPDEYHEAVDDNAYTNVMARWNLRRAVECACRSVGGARPEEAAEWSALADALVDGYDPTTRVYEQFAGFHGLEPLIVRDALPSRPVAADLLLGRDRVMAAQVVKQPDVLMLHHLVPEEVAPGSLEPNLDFYEPRTAHGSSLSPGIHAALFARAGQVEHALEWLRLTARIDLDDLTGSTAGGVHLAAMGSLWQALAFGCLGLRATAPALRLSPRLLPGWRSLEMAVRFRGTRVLVRAGASGVTVDSDRPLPVEVDGWERVLVGPGATSFPVQVTGGGS